VSLEEIAEGGGGGWVCSCFGRGWTAAVVERSGRKEPIVSRGRSVGEGASLPTQRGVFEGAESMGGIWDGRGWRGAVGEVDVYIE
jgi:hypothetical protein